VSSQLPGAVGPRQKPDALCQKRDNKMRRCLAVYLLHGAIQLQLRWPMAVRCLQSWCHFHGGVHVEFHAQGGKDCLRAIADCTDRRLSALKIQLVSIVESLKSSLILVVNAARPRAGRPEAAMDCVLLLVIPSLGR
jgi:hypothetical protein